MSRSRHHRTSRQCTLDGPLDHVGWASWGDSFLAVWLSVSLGVLWRYYNPQRLLTYKNVCWRLSGKTDSAVTISTFCFSEWKRGFWLQSYLKVQRRPDAQGHADQLVHVELWGPGPWRPLRISWHVGAPEGQLACGGHWGLAGTTGGHSAHTMPRSPRGAVLGLFKRALLGFSCWQPCVSLRCTEKWVSCTIHVSPLVWNACPFRSP